MTFPAYRDIEDPLLCYIYRNGGTQYCVRSSDTYEPLAEFFKLSPSKRMTTRDELHNDGRVELVWNKMVQWARRELKNMGVLAQMLKEECGSFQKRVLSLHA
jgi:hypothetical protein